MRLRVKRVYDGADAEDGIRVLVDRVWPRGMRKDQAGIDQWLKDIAPSTALRKWFGHDPAKWDEFKRHYFEELKEQPDTLSRLRQLLEDDRVTLLYSARDRSHNNAVALAEFLRAGGGVKG